MSFLSKSATPNENRLSDSHIRARFILLTSAKKLAQKALSSVLRCGWRQGL